MSTAIADPGNLLLHEVEYQWEETTFGLWRRYVYGDGTRFEEFKSHGSFGTLPVLHYTYGKCPETGKRIMAHGFIAVGRMARGVIAIGQAAFGLIAIGQLAVGFLLGFGQASSGVFAIGQLAIGLAFGLGQVTTGYIAIGQFAFGVYVLAQIGLGEHVWDTMRAVDPAAKQFFERIFTALNVGK